MYRPGRNEDIGRIRKEVKDFIKGFVNYLFFNRLGLRLNYLIKKGRYLLFPPHDLRLNLGCWGVKMDGFVNIDYCISRVTDMVLDVRKLPFPDGTASLIETHHMIEHIPHREVGPMLDEWRRVLVEGGTIIIECPNFDETVREYLAGNEARLYNIYGLQRNKGDYHYFGYSPERLRRLLEDHGFRDCILEEPTDFHRDIEPCMRMTATKGPARKSR